MKMNLAYTLVFIQLFEANAELMFRRLNNNESLELTCSLRQDLGSLRGLHLYHRSAQTQTTVLSMTEGDKFRVDPEHRGRLELCGGLDSLQVNVTLTHLQQSDTGLYMWELSYREKDSTKLILSAQKVFLLVEGAGRPCRCSPSYPLLLLTVSAAAGLVVLTLSCLATVKCVKTRYHHRQQQPSAPIYEEMSWKRQSTGIPQNNNEPPRHLEEDNPPVYANPNIRQPQEHYYACPRQLALRA